MSKRSIAISKPLRPADTDTPTNTNPFNEFGHAPQSPSLTIIFNRELACKLFPLVEYWKFSLNTSKPPTSPVVKSPSIL